MLRCDVFSSMLFKVGSGFRKNTCYRSVRTRVPIPSAQTTAHACNLNIMRCGNRVLELADCHPSSRVSERLCLRGICCKKVDQAIQGILCLSHVCWHMSPPHPHTHTLGHGEDKPQMWALRGECQHELSESLGSQCLSTVKESRTRD